MSNCGVIASGDKSIPQMGREIFDLIVETASGRKTKSEDFGYGDNEFVPWHLGGNIVVGATRIASGRTAH